MNTNFISKEEKIKILIDIINSSEFQNAQKFQELLRYLVDASISGKIIKESTIAIEFFQKDKSFDPSIDSTVRTSISTLRKKLEHYYLT
ncbi:MAG TPA: helix-turn-helix domain-containing protein [Candidatus Marinimicrobia bacterium]|nr:helix-turn-helix domain-containing protein [Candidatus Neomarinimicrobiota bacterium]